MTFKEAIGNVFQTKSCCDKIFPKEHLWDILDPYEEFTNGEICTLDE